MNEDVSRLLHAAAPEGPDPSGWATQAKADARRRGQRRALAGGTLGVLAVAALVVPTLWNRPPQETATPAAPPSSAPVENGELMNPCVTASIADNGDVTELPDGAKRLWLCDSDPELLDSVAAGMPVPLVKGVDEAVDAFQELWNKKTPEDIACTADYGYKYKVVVEYDDGPRVVTGDLFGCRMLSLGDNVEGRLGSEKWLATLNTLFENQGAEATAEVQTPTRCYDASFLPMDLGSVTSVSRCDAKDPKAMDREVLEAMSKSLQDNVRAVDVNDEFAELTGVRYQLTDIFGRVAIMEEAANGTFLIRTGMTNDSLIWTPTMEVASVLEK